LSTSIRRSSRNQDYNVLFAEHGTRSAAQIKPFEDTWRWDEVAAAAYEETVEQGGQVAQAMHAFRTLIGTSDMLAYLSMMAPRLVELRRVLKDTGDLPPLRPNGEPLPKAPPRLRVWPGELPWRDHLEAVRRSQRRERVRSGSRFDPAS
jgi:hypothetical protein